MKFLLRIDDALDLAAEHAMGGIIGLLFNALFADKNLIALDGVNTSAPGGWLNHHYKQLYIQFAYVCATVGYAFFMTALLAKILDMMPWTRLRTSPEEEALGMDDVQARTRRYHTTISWAHNISLSPSSSANSLQTTSKYGGTIATGRQLTMMRFPYEQQKTVSLSRPPRIRLPLRPLEIDMVCQI